MENFSKLKWRKIGNDEECVLMGFDDHQVRFIFHNYSMDGKNAWYSNAWYKIEKNMKKIGLFRILHDLISLEEAFNFQTQWTADPDMDPEIIFECALLGSPKSPKPDSEYSFTAATMDELREIPQTASAIPDCPVARILATYLNSRCL